MDLGRYGLDRGYAAKFGGLGVCEKRWILLKLPQTGRHTVNPGRGGPSP